MAPFLLRAVLRGPQLEEPAEEPMTVRPRADLSYYKAAGNLLAGALRGVADGWFAVLLGLAVIFGVFTYAGMDGFESEIPGGLPGPGRNRSSGRITGAARPGAVRLTNEFAQVRAVREILS